MKAVQFHEHGGPEVLRYEEVPEPAINAAEVLVRVRAWAMNHLDLWLRKGYPGRLITCGATTGPDVRIDIRYLFGRQLSVLGSFMGSKAELLEVLKFIFQRRLRPVIDAAFPLAEARAAHQRTERREQFGKIILHP